MSVLFQLQANFSRGALTPLVAGRHDKDWYEAGLTEVTNFQILKYGILRRRSGTRFCGLPKYADKKVDFRRFAFSSTQAFFLEFGHQYIRVWTTSGEQVLDNLDVPIEVVTPYTEADIFRIQVVQDGDHLFIAHPGHRPRVLRRLSNTNWQLGDVSFIDGPYLPINDTAVSVTPSASPTTGASITLTFSSVTPINRGAGFGAGDVGRLIRAQWAGNWSFFRVTAVTNTTTVVTTCVRGNGGGTDPTVSWRLGAVAASQGYFGSVKFFKGRLCWSRTAENPRAHWFSMSGLPLRYDPSTDNGTVNDDHGFMVESLSGLSDEVLWTEEASAGYMLIGTASSIRSLSSSDDTNIFGPRSYTEALAVPGGAHSIQPVLVGPSAIHVGRFGLALNDCHYDYQSNGLVAPELSILAEHLVRSGIVRVEYQQSPSSVVWALLSDGSWLGMTYERYERVIGFHHHRTRDGDAVESLCTAPDYVAKRDTVIMAVRRSIGGETVRYVEMVEPDFDGGDIKDAWFVDCGLRYDGEPANTLEGLDHLAGQEVSVFADGAVFPVLQVTLDGELSLPNGRAAAKILIGLPMTARAKVLRANLLGRDGPQLGLKKRSPYVFLDLYETGGLKIKPVSSGIAEEVKLRSSSDAMNTSSPLYTGIKRKSLDDRQEQDEIDGQLEIICDRPLPATIRAINIGYDIQT